ncbi:hypothetical protein CEUSTIGMA_g9933.t1 [Chlamydomonas eustigma]|uniref:Bidirectional sugar transporter SWEET n=1 Tax=Chlamydomonas eustigma TaxID=1157962 RepID=A0A250XHL4_9CHLO|nr:hypothetical protein CEUSTIGMA_g9933.t1 [Chlamydomonas eustigma]|eukprot:GAX82506.1 hypothetical protein CEUSTIGMA_g9933.t1 [Chlamydomonas eustigma]
MSGILAKYVAPSVGTIVGAIMLLSPIKAVWEIRKTKQLGEINPLPYPMTVVNCVSWVIYGAVAADPFIAPANILGIVAGLFFTMTALPHCTQKLQDIIQGIMVFSGCLFGILSMIGVFALDSKGIKQMWGAMSVAVVIIYYVIPLSTMIQVVRHRDASSIYLPLAVASIVNGGAWTVYGLAVQDVNLWGPNGFGAFTGCVQVALRLLFGAKKAREDVAHGRGQCEVMEIEHRPKVEHERQRSSVESLASWKQDDMSDSKALLPKASEQINTVQTEDGQGTKMKENMGANHRHSEV